MAVITRPYLQQRLDKSLADLQNLFISGQLLEKVHGNCQFLQFLFQKLLASDAKCLCKM